MAVKKWLYSTFSTTLTGHKGAADKSEHAIDSVMASLRTEIRKKKKDDHHHHPRKRSEKSPVVPGVRCLPTHLFSMSCFLVFCSSSLVLLLFTFISSYFHLLPVWFTASTGREIQFQKPKQHCCEVCTGRRRVSTTLENCTKVQKKKKEVALSRFPNGIQCITTL